MAALRGVFTVVAENQAVSTAITILEVTASSSSYIELIRAWCSAVNPTAQAFNRIQILVKTATITGTASPPTAASVNPKGLTSNATIKWKATAEGTDGAVLIPDTWNVLAPTWTWSPVTEKDRIFVPPSGIIAMKFPAAPTSLNYTYGFEYEEVAWA